MRFKSPLLAAGLLLSLITHNAIAGLTAYTAAGNQRVVYDNVTDITWTGDANLYGTMHANNPDLVNTIIDTIGSISDTANHFDTPANSGAHTLTSADFDVNLLSWYGAQAFVKYLNSINYVGSQLWALPTVGANPQLGFQDFNAPLYRGILG